MILLLVRNLLAAMVNVSPVYGHVMVMMTAGITQTRIQIIVRPINARNPSFVAVMVGAYSMPGNVITKMIVVIERMNRTAIIQNVQQGSLHARTTVVFPKHRFAMV